MRQAPTIYTLLIGDGRMANHWLHYLTALDEPVQRWSRSSGSLESLQAHVQQADVIFLAITDDALSPFYKDHLALSSAKVIHFSGAKFSKSMTGCHPLMTFGPDLYDLETMKTIPFVIDTENSAIETHFDFPNPTFKIKPHEKARYHALCAMAANFPQWIWSFAFGAFEDLQLPTSALKGLLTQSLLNSLKDPGRSLTGPMARGDDLTMTAHLRSLEGGPEKTLYRAFMTYAESIQKSQKVLPEESPHASL